MGYAISENENVSIASWTNPFAIISRSREQIGFRKHGANVCLRVSASELLDYHGKKILKTFSVSFLDSSDRRDSTKHLS